MLLSALCASLYQQGFKSEIAAARGPKRFFLSCPLLVCELDDCKKGGELVIMLPEAAAGNAAAAAAAATASGAKSASTFAASARVAAAPLSTKAKATVGNPADASGDSHRAVAAAAARLRTCTPSAAEKAEREERLKAFPSRTVECRCGLRVHIPQGKPSASCAGCRAVCSSDAPRDAPEAAPRDAPEATRGYVATPAITCAIGLLQATPSKKMLLSALCASLYQQGFKSEIAAARGPKRFFLSCPLLVCELDDCKKGGELVMLPEAAAANAAAAAAAAASGFKSASTFAAGGAPPEASARFAASPPVSASAAGSAAPALPPVPSPPGTVPETALARAPPWIYDPTTRRLVFREGLCGAIFGATNTTLDECLQRRLFGLPHTRRALVAAISKQHETPSLPQPVLFLFNFQKRELHGVFAASGSAGFPLHADAWVKGSWSTELGGPVAKPPRATSGHTTQFPAQIPVDRLHVFAPLAESVFRHVMKYHSQNKFDLSLSAEQVEQLVCLFIEQAKSHGHGDSRTLRSAHPKASSAP